MSEEEVKETPRVQGDTRKEPAERAWLIPAMVTAAVGAFAVVLLVWLFTAGTGGGAPTRTPTDVSATSEAIQFATSEAIRQVTREVAGATKTEVARTTETAVTREQNAAATRTTNALAAQARQTAEAPATQTAAAEEHATTLARAEATGVALRGQSSAVSAPTSGTLTQQQAGEVACSSPAATSRDFVAEVHFQNPATSAQASTKQSWDYGLIFAHPDDGLQYRLILNSDGKWILNLHTDGYDIENRDDTPLLDLSPQGSNSLKLAVVGEEAHLYINGAFIDTLDLTMFSEGGASDAGYDVAVCAGIMQGSAVAEKAVLYDNYSLRTTP